MCRSARPKLVWLPFVRFRSRGAHFFRGQPGKQRRRQPAQSFSNTMSSSHTHIHQREAFAHMYEPPENPRPAPGEGDNHLGNALGQRAQSLGMESMHMNMQHHRPQVSLETEFTPEEIAQKHHWSERPNVYQDPVIVRANMIEPVRPAGVTLRDCFENDPQRQQNEREAVEEEEEGESGAY